MSNLGHISLKKRPRKSSGSSKDSMVFRPKIVLPSPLMALGLGEFGPPVINNFPLIISLAQCSFPEEAHEALIRPPIIWDNSTALWLKLTGHKLKVDFRIDWYTLDRAVEESNNL